MRFTQSAGIRALVVIWFERFAYNIYVVTYRCTQIVVVYATCTSEVWDADPTFQQMGISTYVSWASSAEGSQVWGLDTC
jgi:hypothetical protein